jgi:signal transduction histidine kinase/HPt (histidine-containing phosphotransfer) domain-containing protein/ActR/RegA family two-component response regulator
MADARGSTQQRAGWGIVQADVRRMFFVAIVAGLALLGVIGRALYANVQESHHSAAQVEHTHEVLQSASEVASAALLYDASQRGLLVTGSEYFRESRAEAFDALRKGTATLERLTADNPPQQQRVRALQRLVDEREQVAGDNERMVATVPGSLGASIESPESIRISTALQTTLARIKSHERDLLTMRQNRLDRDQQQTLWTVAATIAIGAALMAWAAWGYRREKLAHGRAESRFRDLVQALPVSLWLLRADPNGSLRFEFVSENTSTLRNVDVQDERTGFETVFRTIVEEDQPRVQAALRRSIDKLEPYSVEYRIPHKDGVRWIHSNARVRRTEDGAVLLSGYWADVTREHDLLEALEAARDEATRATQAKSAFLAAMSHEIRTPMNGVLGLLELLSLSRLDAEQKATLSVVRASGQSLLRIVDDILDFSKMEAEHLALSPAPASLRQLVESTCQVYASHASAKGLLLHAEVDERIAPAHLFDRQRLGQILNNLVSNALKFTERGRVVVRVASNGRDGEDERLLVTVEDTGIGVAEEDMARLFQPFVQSGHDTAARFGGTGLGLVISRRLAELMGGTLAMESTHGKGTRMVLSLRFPVADGARTQADDAAAADKALEDAVHASRAAPGVDQAQAEGTLVLVVDDHPTNRMVLKRQLQSLGYAAEAAADGVQGLAAWRTGRFGLVLADCNMPEMNGYELVRAIRAEEAARGLPRTPVFACTANAMPTEAAICTEAGMDEYVVKPIGLGRLARLLARWLPLPVAPASGFGGVDSHTIQAISGGDPATEAEILDEYQRTHASDAADLRAAIAVRDTMTALQVAHRIRGACMALGSFPLAEATGELEDVLREGNWEQVPAAMDAFDAELERLFASLGMRKARATAT